MCAVDVGLHLAIFPTEATSRQISWVCQAAIEHLTSQSKRLEIEEALVCSSKTLASRHFGQDFF